MYFVLNGHESRIGHGGGRRFQLHLCFDIAPQYNIFVSFTLAEITTGLTTAIYP